MGRAEFGVSGHGFASRTLHGCLLLTLTATLIVVSPVADQAADAAVTFPTSFDVAKENSTSIDAMVYGGTSINPNSPNTTSVVDLNALGMWSYQQPFYPDNLQSHPGYAAKINGMEPPANGNFWFPQYHNDHVYFAHYSICFNNNLPDGTGCQTESQSIGVYDIVNHSYFRVDIPSVLGQPAPVHGSISDIKINPRNQRLYYIGYPNYIGWINFNAGTGRFDGGAGFGLAKYKDQMPQPAQVANEFDILPTNDLVVINRNNPRIEIFDQDLGLRHTFHPGGSPLVPLSVTTSPRCQRTDPNAGCVAGRFAVNFESTSVTVDTESAHPIRDYVYNRRDNGITRLSPLLIPTSDVWLGGNTVQSGGHLAVNVDADYKGIKYDADGVLWAGTFHRAYPYNPAQVFAWVPQHDTSGTQGDSYPWDSQYSGPYRSSCDPNPKTIGSMTAAFIGCRPRGEGVPKQIFQSSGRLVDSIVQAGPNVYWQGWAGSMEGVIRMNPGQMPPEYKRDARWGPAQTRPAGPHERCPGEKGTIANATTPPDAFVLNRCAWGVGAIRVPQNVQDQYAGDPGNPTRPLPWSGWTSKFWPGVPDQVNRFVYDPQRNAIWGTIQTFFDLAVPTHGARSCLSSPPPGSFEDTACPLISDKVKLPQWMMRHNLGAPTEQQAYIADPTGSVAGNRGDRLTVGAQIYSVNQPVVTITCTPVCFGASGSSPVSVSPVAPGLWQATARVDVPASGAAQYTISASNANGPAQNSPQGPFDVIEVQKTSQYWEFAEGNYQDGFETFFTIINPDQVKTAHPTLTLRPDTAAPTYTRTCSIAPKGRLTVRTSTLIAGLADPYNQTCGAPQAAAGWTKSPNTGFGTTITSDLPVVAERPMYFKADVDLDPYSSVISGSHNAMGMSETAPSWNFAEGVFSSTPGNNWQFYLTLSNPSDKVARVSVALLREEGGMTAPDICRIQPGKRITLKMNARIAGQNEPAPPVCDPTNWGGAIGNGKGYGIVISAADDGNPASPVSIVAERVTYVDSGTVLGSLSAANPAMTIPRISEGNVAGGSPKARSRWMLAEGFIQAQDENNAFQTYLTVANPNAKNCAFTVTYLTRGGPPVVEQRTLGAHTRQTIAVSEPVRNVIANLTSSGIDVAFTIQSTTSACDLIAERPVYFRSGVGAFVNPTDGGHHTMGTTFARTEWRFAEGYLPPSSADPSDAQFLTVMNTSSKPARVHVEFLPDPASGLDIARLDEVVDPKARKTISTNNFLRGAPGWPGTSPNRDVSYGMVVSSEPDSATGERAPIIAERPMYWKTGHDVGGVQTKGGTNVLPLHNDGLDLAQVTTNPYTIAEPEANPFRITRLTGDITATAGQTLVIEAEITPTPDSVELIVERDNNLRVSKVAMVQTSPTRWVATYKATGASATFQVVGKTGNLGVQSAPRRINVVSLAITGRVTGAGESIFTSPAVPHVEVTAVGLTATPAPATTNADGYYWIPVPAAGDYKLSVLPNNHLLEEIAGQTGSDSPRAPGYADMFSNHVTSPDDSEAIAVAGSGQHYDETLPKAGRLFGKITGRATSQISLAGNKVAFSSNRDGNDEIYVMSSDGTDQTRTTQDAASDIWPSFSPDGSKIAFVSNRSSGANLEGDYELFVMNSDGTGITQLTFDGGDEFAPAWSPDGTRIAFSRPPGETGNSDIFVVSADGTGEVNLTNSPEADTQPTWTPDSSQIAFVRTVEFLNTAIYVMSSDGASEILLSEQGDLLPSYSPDGSRITFTSFRDGQTEIYAMATDGTNQTRLTTLPGADAGSKYSLDGEKIVFVSNRHNPTDPNSDLDIYSMDADGVSQTRITTGALLTSPPSVGPDSAPDEPVLLAGVPVGFYDAASGKAIGVETVSADDGTYEKWLVPGSYYGLVNRPGAQKPLGWNGYAPMWSRGQLFDNANGGNQSAITLPDVGSAERYDEELLPVFPVRGKVIPSGGPGLGDGGSIGSTQAQLPNGRFWPIALPADGNYVYPLPSGQWILSFSVPGYRASYYHSTEDPAQVTPVVVADSGQTLLHQQINPE